MKQIPDEILQRCTFYRTPNSPPAEQARITRIKDHPLSKCGECNEPVNDVRTYSYLQTPFWHWREKCITCKRYRHPVTGEMFEGTAIDLSRSLNNQASVDAYNAKKNVFKADRDK